MLKQLLESWSDWTGDKRLTQAIRRELARLGYAVNAAETREVRLTAIERPGWVQVYRFRVETVTNDENPHSRREVTLHGVSRDDGRKSRIEVLLSESLSERNQQLEDWSEGLIRRR
ncbi:hypothetical protein MalM25_19390 [Planctomycetes bacterium MalM25]|nr:hypothetical protein MalM25_19390 [Planctomycetes bacterium MalM25]